MCGEGVEVTDQRERGGGVGELVPVICRFLEGASIFGYFGGKNSFQCPTTLPAAWPVVCYVVLFINLTGCSCASYVAVAVC
jgi:hypothetical protein